MIVKESGAVTFLERSFIALIPVSMYATGAPIGNGQLIVHLLPALIAGLLLLYRGKGKWRDDLLAAALLVFALVKPSVSAPFSWMAIFAPGRARPILLVICGYFVVTIIATSFQETGSLTLFRNWSEHSRNVSAPHTGKYSSNTGMQTVIFVYLFLHLFYKYFYLVDAGKIRDLFAGELYSIGGLDFHDKAKVRQ